jgi:spore germination protein GerM
MEGRVRAASVRAGAVMCAVLFVVAGCGGGTQSQPEKLRRSAVPFGLLEPATSTVPPTTVQLRRYPFVVYFIGSDGVVPVVRTANERPTPSVVGAALLAGPILEEVQVGMRTRIPARSVGSFSAVAKRTVTINLNPRFVDVNGSTQKLALTQIVFTMTQLRGVKFVRFLLGGEPTLVPRLNGTLTTAPVRRFDYQSANPS